MYIFTEFGRLVFWVTVYVVIRVKCDRLKCTLNEIPVVRKFTAILLGF